MNWTSSSNSNVGSSNNGGSLDNGSATNAHHCGDGVTVRNDSVRAPCCNCCCSLKQNASGFAWGRIASFGVALFLLGSIIYRPDMAEREFCKTSCTCALMWALMR